MNQLGAINILTNKYTYPKIGTARDKYNCPKCKDDVVFCSGNESIRPYFRHKISHNCGYYGNPGLGEIHNDAKLLLKTLLENRVTIKINRCAGCFEPFMIPEITENCSIVNEYRFDHNGSVCIADVAYLKDNKIEYIFEIYNTHLTNESKRPEPWFEIEAYDLIKQANDIENNSIDLYCIRHIHKCVDCIKCKKKHGMCGIANFYKSNPICLTCDIELYSNRYYDVSYEDRNMAKEDGLWWDGLCKKWYLLSNKKDYGNFDKIENPYFSKK